MKEDLSWAWCDYFSASRRFDSGWKLVWRQLVVKLLRHSLLLSFYTSQTHGWGGCFSSWSFVCCVGKSFPCTKESKLCGWGLLLESPGLVSCTLCPTMWWKLRFRFSGSINIPLARACLSTPVTSQGSCHCLDFGQRIADSLAILLT